jgi:hypothetical protein
MMKCCKAEIENHTVEERQRRLNPVVSGRRANGRDQIERRFNENVQIDGREAFLGEKGWCRLTNVVIGEGQGLKLSTSKTVKQ